MYKRVYLAGDNHSCWQKELQAQAKKAQLAINFRCPHRQPESDQVNAETVEYITGARCVEAVNDALLTGSELIVIRFDGDSDHHHALAAGQAIVQGKSIVVLHENVYADKLASISRVATAVAGDMQQLLSILEVWSNSTATDKN